MQKRCVVIIPVYMSEPSGWDMVSFRRGLDVLRAWDICLITFPELDLSVYENAARDLGKSYHVEYFDRSYFASGADYNRLCLTKNFYERFADYEYMLIYQTDAWVFADELLSWCNKGYDYVGPPTFRILNRKGEEAVHTFDYDGVGNGGFSLRKTEYCLRVLSACKHIPYLRFGYLAQLYHDEERQRGRGQSGAWLIAFCKAVVRGWLGYRNTLGYFLRSNAFNEDYILSEWAKHSNVVKHVSIPQPEEAALFAFEVHPSYLFDITTRLPFGCHAFRKWEYDEFWSKYIKR